MHIQINKRALLLLITLSVLTSCNNSTDKKIVSGSENQAKEIQKDEISISCHQLVKSFLFWYKSKYDTISKINFIKPRDNKNEFYKVNFEKTEEYLKILKGTAFFSEKFLQEKEKYFERCNEQMAENKQIDGPPIGLNYDLLLLTQDIDYSLNAIENIRLKDSINAQKNIFVDAEFIDKLRFYIVIESNTVKIDSIGLIMK